VSTKLYHLPADPEATIAHGTPVPRIYELVEARAVLNQDAPMPPKSATRKLLAALLGEIIEGKDVRRHYFGSDPRPAETAREEFALAVVWHLAERIVPVAHGQTKVRMREILAVAFGPIPKNARRPESKLERALANYGYPAANGKPSGLAWRQVFLNRGHAARVRREACANFGPRAGAVEAYLRNLAKTRQRTGRAPK
jgi:hypothetical protein